MGKIPFSWINWQQVLLDDPRPSFHAKAIGMFLHTYMNDRNDLAFPSVSTIMGRLNIGSDHTVTKYTNELVSLGYLLKEKRFGQSVKYHAITPELDSIASGAKLDTVSHDVRHSIASGAPSVSHDVRSNNQVNNQLNNQDTYSPSTKAETISKNWQPNEHNLCWLKDSGMSEFERKAVIRDFVEYWLLAKTKRKNWDLSFRKNPIVQRKVNTHASKQESSDYMAGGI